MTLTFSRARRIAVATCAAAIAGCTAIDVRLPAPRSVVAVPADGAQLRAGAARADITVPPGYPMGGYSWIGRVARGHWLPLYVRALFFEDAGGRRLALVACDLWSLPGGLHSRVAELLATDSVLRARLGGRTIDRDELVVAATHTHHSPGAFSTDTMFSTFGAPKIGFDRELFEFLARRIAGAVADAAASARPAQLRFGVRRVDSLLRNRSLEAFRRNVDGAQLIARNADLAPCEGPGYEPDACRAVDPTLRVLDVRDAAGDRSIGAAVFLAAHPTVIHHDSPLLSSDVFGAVALGLERELGGADGASPVVALFNGAEGDVSFRWSSQDRDELARLADAFSANVRAALAGVQPLARTAIASSYDSFSLAHRRVGAADATHARTARIPMPGRASMSGAEDGRNDDVPHWVAHEGKHGFAWGAHGTKIGAFDLAEIGGFVIPPLWPTRLASLFVRPEPRAAVSVHRLGPLVLATLPGEFTTMMGSRIHAAVTSAAAAESENVALVGLAQSYAYYFASPEEYDAQHYEGSGTLWGRHAGELVASRLAALAAARPALRSTQERSERYLAGLPREFGPAFVETPPDEGEADLVRVLGDGRLARWCWSEPVTRLRDAASATAPAVPRVQVERSAGEAWIRTSEPQTALDTAMLAGPPDGGAMCWCAYWRVPRDAQASRTFRFAVTRAGAERACAEPGDCSPAFSPAVDALHGACPASLG